MKRFIFAVTCNSTVDELNMVNELRFNNYLIKLTLNEFLKRCEVPNEIEIEQFLKEYPHCNEKDLLAYELKWFMS